MRRGKRSSAAVFHRPSSTIRPHQVWQAALTRMRAIPACAGARFAISRATCEIQSVCVWEPVGRETGRLVRVWRTYRGVPAALCLRYVRYAGGQYACPVRTVRRTRDVRVSTGSHEHEELVWEIHEGNDRLIRLVRCCRRSQARAAPLHVWPCGSEALVSVEDGPTSPKRSRRPAHVHSRWDVNYVTRKDPPARSPRHVRYHPRG